MKLVGYTTTVHTLIDRLDDDSSVVLFGGRACRPYPGSTTVTNVGTAESTASSAALGHASCGAGAVQRHRPPGK